MSALPTRVLAAGAAALLLVRRRRTPAVTLPAGPLPAPFDGYLLARAPWAEKVLVTQSAAWAAVRRTRTSQLV